ncbi:hypothetical protein X975_12814, partial [Stegodyphus mimosarum]
MIFPETIFFQGKILVCLFFQHKVSDSRLVNTRCA